MIIDEETRALRNKQIAKERSAAKRENWRVKRQSNKILKRLRNEYVETGKTQGIELLACSYPRWDLEKILRRLADMKFITFTNRSDAYYVDFVLPDSPKSNTTNEPKSEASRVSKPKSQKPNIDDFEPPKGNIWEDLA